MEGQNLVRLDGAIATEPEFARVGNDLARLTFTVAGIDHLRGSDNEPLTSSWYHNVTIFGRYAEAMLKHLRVGAIISLKGRINHHEYTKNGERRSITNVIADSITMLDHHAYGDDALVIDAKGQPRLDDADNFVEIAGNLTKDAVSSITNNQNVPLTSFRVAINRPTRNENSGTDYIDVVAWREHATSAATLRKGDGVLVRGRLVTNSYQENGARRYRTLINAERVRPAQRRAREQPTTHTATSVTRPAANTPPNASEPTANPDDNLPF